MALVFFLGFTPLCLGLMYAVYAHAFDRAS